MRLTTRTTYGLRAIVELAQSYNRKPLKRKEISDKQDIPEAYLLNILLTLKTAGIIGSIRGPEGGYILNRPPSFIRLGEVVEVLDGQIDPVGCINNSDKCSKIDNCLTKNVWIKLRELEHDFLYSVTLEDIIEQRF